MEQENKKDDASGPWKAMTTSETSPDEDDKPVSVSPELINTDPGEEKPKPAKYVPPNMRNQSAQQNSNKLEPVRVAAFGRRGAGRAPELDNKEEFPSLGDAPPPELGKDFMPVRHGARDLVGKSQSGASAVTVGNKYNALSQSRQN